MNFLKLLLITILILALQYLIKDTLATNTEISKGKNKEEESTSSGDYCPCGEIKLTHEFIVDINTFKLNKNIEFNEIIQVEHAFWSNSGFCVDLKIVKMEGRRILLRESNVLNFFEENEAKHIIKMLDMNSSYNFDVLVLERAKMNIKKYFQENVNKKESEIDKFEFLTKIIKGAAEALAELHEYGYVHLNVKPENFVYTEIPKDENKIENCKLTGLDKAVTLGMTSEEDTIQFVLNNFGIKENIQEFCIICLGTNNSNFVQFPCNHFVHMNCIKPWLKTSLCCPNCKNDFKKLDVKYFGFMTYNILMMRSTDQINLEKIKEEINGYISEKGKNLSKLDHVIKACNKENLMNIPTMDKIFKFLNGNTDLSNFEKPEKEEHHQGESSHQGQEHGGIGPDLEQRREHEEAGPHGRQEHGEREGRRSQGLLRRFNRFLCCRTLEN